MKLPEKIERLEEINYVALFLIDRFTHLPYNAAIPDSRDNSLMIDSQNPLKNSRFTHPDAFSGRCGWVKLASLAVLALIGWLDYATGYEFGFFIFYFIPVAISAWYCGRWTGIKIAGASALVWYISDKYTYHPYSKAYFIYWEMFMRLLSFLTTALTLARVRDMVLNEEKLLKELLDTRQELVKARNSHP